MSQAPLIEQMAVAYATQIEEQQAEIERLDRLTAELDIATKYAEAYFDESELLKKQVAKLRQHISDYGVSHDAIEIENAKLRAALKTIADYYGKYFQEGEVAYQAAIIARAALANEQEK